MSCSTIYIVISLISEKKCEQIHFPTNISLHYEYRVPEKKFVTLSKKRKKGIEFHGRLQSVYCTMYNRIVQINNIVLKDILRAELRDQADDTSLDLPIHY